MNIARKLSLFGPIDLSLPRACTRLCQTRARVRFWQRPLTIVKVRG